MQGRIAEQEELQVKALQEELQVKALQEELQVKALQVIYALVFHKCNPRDDTCVI